MTASPQSSAGKPKGKHCQLRRCRQQGAALVLTLGILSLLVLLVVSYLSLATTESRSTRGYADGQSVKRLADSVTQLVMSQLREATEGFAKDGSGNLDTSSPLAWATQPGMVHTFNSAGTPDRIFKLYSSDEMVVDRSSSAPLDEASAMNGWESQPGVFTDLNSPVIIPGETDGDFTPQSPILDVDDLVNGSSLTPPVSGLTYSTDGIRPDIEGFSIDPPASYRSGEPISPTNNPVPMPVRWLYVLEDGQLTTPRHNASDGTAEFDLPGQPVPTEANPIVARVAFWADDECAKVNVNTASEGTYWDIPRIWSQEDIGAYTGSDVLQTPGLAFGQPAQKEFQRYSGHPATTSLSPVLGRLLPRPTTIDNSAAGQFEKYYVLTPRTNVGGSRSGTEIVKSPIPIKNDRLFPSVSDFYFSPEIDPGGRGRPPGGRKRNGTLTPDLIRRAGFFLSAHSKAPETTLFNTPRIAIWPVWEDAAKRTAYDKLAAFCSTIGGSPYHFTRSNSRSGTAGLTQRNRDLYTWLFNLTANEIPGYGGNFAAKLGQDHQHVLTYIYDYIRTTNPQDRSDNAYEFTPIYNSVNQATPGAGEVIPIRIGNTQGFGRYPALSSPGIMFVGVPPDPDKPDEKRMEAIFVAEFATPGHGMACMRSKMKWRVRGLDKLKIKFGDSASESLRLPPDGTCLFEQGDLDHWGGRGIGGTLSLLTTFRANARTNKGFNNWGGDAEPLNYPFFSEEPLTIPEPDSDGEPKNFKLEGGHEIVFEIMTETGEIVQTARFSFPEGDFKIPTYAKDIRTRNMWTVWDVMLAQDTIIGLEIAGELGNATDEEPDPTAGDKRMIIGLHDIPASRFRAHQKYSTEGVAHAHSFTLTTGPNSCAGNSSGKLINVPGYVSFGYNRTPDVPPRVGDFVTRIGGAPGEWDSGFGDQPDGAYINKPNDGDSAYDNRQGGGRFRPPYILGYNQGFAAARNEFFSPNLQVPSPLMFGSLPTGVARLRPWETLLFHPRPEDPTHPGGVTPHDHLLADLFWMPVIEPYAISQPFATAGKINLNYRIQPFDYIHRKTGMHAVFKSTQFLALLPTDAQGYKPLDPVGRGTPFMSNRRRSIDPETTLAEFDSRYESDGVFRSPGEICEMHLIPPGETATGMRAFWEAYSLSGDNVRERPYVDIYPRVTTRSNTFTIHYKVQVLRQVRSSEPDVWNPERDLVVAEQRGATVIEREVDPNDSRLPDFATIAPGSPEAVIDRYYRFRVLSSKTFKPGPAR